MKSEQTFNLNSKLLTQMNIFYRLIMPNITGSSLAFILFVLFGSYNFIESSEKDCCGVGVTVPSDHEIQIREIPNIKKSIRGNRYGPYELDFSEEDPKHAYDPITRVDEKDKIFDYKYQKGKILIKIHSNWAIGKNFWEEIEFPGVQNMVQLFPNAKNNKVIGKMSTVLPEAGQSKPDLWRWFEAELANNETVFDVIKNLRGRPEIDKIEPVFIYSTNGPVYNDKDVDEEIYTIQELPSKGAKTDPEWTGDSLYHIDALNVPNAWKYLEKRQATNKTPGGSPDVIIAILDTGVDYNHEDLKPNMWVNSGEIAGNNIDDDKNGFIDDVNGVSVVSNKESHSGDPMDFNGHGTHCAGIAAAAASNDKGIVGVAYGCKIMAIKSGQYAGIFSTTDIAEGVYYAIENGADIINMSLGGPDSEVVRDALSVAFGDIVLIAAAGNSGRPNEYPCPGYSPSYPAAHNWVLGVEAREKYLQAWGWRAKFSNYDCVPYTKYEYEVMAPGVSIYSTWPGGGYTSLDGTSMAAPTIAGMAGLLRTQWPKNKYSSRFIMGQIIGSPSNQPRVPDALLALSSVPTPKLFMKEFWLFDNKDVDAVNDNDGVVDAGETIDLALVIRNQWGKATNIKVKVEPIAKIEQGGSKLKDQAAYKKDGYVEMITDEVSYDPLGSFNRGDNKLIYDSGGAIIGVKMPFKFKVKNNTPNDHFIPFQVTLTAKNGYDVEDTKNYSTQQRFQVQVQNGSEIPTIVSSDLNLTKDKFWIAVRPILVEEGATITVEAGTQIQLGGPDPKTVYRDPFGRAFIQVEGKFETKGTADSLVSIFPAPFWMPSPKFGGKGQNSVIRVRGDGVFNMKYTEVMNPEVKGDKFDHVRFRYDIANNNPFYIRATELSYAECDLIIPTAVSMDTCLISRVNGKLRPGGLWYDETGGRDPLKESRYGGSMNNTVILGHMLNMDVRYSPSIQAYQDIPHELFKDKKFESVKHYKDKTYAVIYPRTWLSEPGELTSVRGWNKKIQGKNSYETFYSKSALKTASLVAQYFGGQVLNIDDVNENVFIADYIKNILSPEGITDEVIIPLSDLDYDGEYNWQNGQKPIFTNWGDGFPSIPSRGEYFVKVNDSGIWSNSKWIRTGDNSNQENGPTELQGLFRWTGYDRIHAGWYGTNIRAKSWKFSGELPTIIELPGIKTKENLDAEYPNLHASLSSKYHAVQNNAFLSSTWDPNTKNLIRISAENVYRYHSGDSERDIDYTKNYWGPVADKRVNAMIHDGVDYGTGQKILYKPRLNPSLEADYLKMQEIWPFVVDIKITTDELKRITLANVPNVGMGTAIFEIIFNRDMDVTKPLRANFGPDDPFTDYPIRPYGDNNGWQKDLRTWIGTFNITPVTGDGYQMIRTYKATAKSDPWLESGRDTGRFRFTINTVSIESLNLQVNSAEGANKLIWVQRDFDMLAGFNLYRSATKDGSYKKINRALIPKNKRSYLDKKVAAGSKYFYKFTVVDTAGVESAYSNLDDGVPIKVVLPSIKHTPIVSGDVLKDINLDAQVTDNVSINNVSVYYRLMGLTSYKKLTANKVGGNLPGYLRFNAKIPGAEVLSPGVEYYIEVFDGVNENSHGTPDTPNKVILKNTLYLSYLEPDSGTYEGGTKVTLTGMNFENGVEVYFGREKADNVNINSSTELTCITPKYFPSYVDVRVENKSKQVSRLTSGFGYTSQKVNLTLSDRKVALNKSVVVPLDIGAFSGLASMDTVIYYNSNELTPISVSAGDLISKWSFSSNIGEKGKIKISAASPSGTLSGTGNLANIEFKAIGTAGKLSSVSWGRIILNEGSIPYNTVDGTVSIASSEDSRATIEISRLRHVYDGSPKSASISVSVSVDQTIVTYSGKSYDGVVYNESKIPPTNAGVYTVKAKVYDKKYTGEKEEFLEINRAPVSLKLSNLTHYKDGKSKKPTITASIDGIALKTVYKDLNDNTLSEAPSQEGVYKVSVTVDNNNYQGSAFSDLTIQKIVGAITLDKLTQIYDGKYKPVEVITNPSGVDVTVRYDGFEIVPINAGSYEVNAEFNDPKYKGTASGTLIIKKKEAKIEATNLIQDYDGLKKAIKISTVPSGLNYTVNYNDKAEFPIDYGNYVAKISINDSNYSGNVTKNLIIKKPDATIVLSKLARVYTGKESPVGIEINPPALKYTVSYNDSAEVPINPGKYNVKVSILDESYQGEAKAELIITKAIGKINFSNMSQSYDGKSKKAEITTDPPGLSVITKYNGSDLEPMTAGSYDVIVTIDDPRYQGSKSETLIITKKSAEIRFDNLSSIEDGSEKEPVITTVPIGLDITVKYTNSDGQVLLSPPSKTGIYKVDVNIQSRNYFGIESRTFKINAKDPFGEPVTYPQNSAILLGIVDISGSTAPEGDVIAAYVGGELRAKQQIVISGGKSFVTLTISVLQEGERMRLKLWRRDTNVLVDYEGEFIISPAKEIGSGDDFPNNLTTLSFGGSIGQTIAFRKGWNLISFSLIADDMSPSKLFNPIKNSVNTIKDITSVYNPSIPEFLNTLKRITLGSGYWVNMKDDRILSLNGSMPKEITINLNEGWNLVGFPDVKENPPSQVFKSILNDLITVKSVSSVYNPGVPDFLNTLKLIQPGSGYWVKMKKANKITFNSGGSGSREITKFSPTVITPISWGELTIYPNVQASIFGVISIEENEISQSDLIGAFVDGELRGIQSPVINNGIGYVTLSVNMRGDENVILKYWDSSENKTYKMKDVIKSSVGETIGEYPNLKKLEFNVTKNNYLRQLSIIRQNLEYYILYDNNNKIGNFELQSSKNLKEWNTVEVYNNTININYKLDKKQLSNKNYYRLKSLDQ